MKAPLDHELRTYVTRETSEALDHIAEERGEGTKVSQLVREAIRDFLKKHHPKPESGTKK